MYSLCIYLHSVDKCASIVNMLEKSMEYLQRIKSALYMWDDSRVTRIQYFSYSIIGMLITTGMLALINPLLDLEGSFWVVASLVLLLAAIVHNVYVSVVLVRKRLCDMGYAYDHMWWIFGLWFVTFIHSWGEPDSTVTNCLLALDVVTSLWLLFTPSTKK